MKKIIVLLIVFAICIAYFVSNFNNENNIFIEQSSISKSSKVSFSTPISSCDYLNYNIKTIDPKNTELVAGRIQLYYEQNERLINNENTKLIEKNFPQISNAKIIGFRINNIEKDMLETQYLYNILSMTIDDYVKLDYKQFIKDTLCNQAKIVRNDIFNNGGAEAKNKNILLNEIISDYNKVEGIGEIDGGFDDLSRVEELKRVYFPDLFVEINNIVTIDN